jgi:hypothetical protein
MTHLFLTFQVLYNLFAIFLINGYVCHTLNVARINRSFLKFFFGMKKFFTQILLVSAVFISSTLTYGQKYSYSDPWGSTGFSVLEADDKGVEINYSISGFEFMGMDYQGLGHKKLLLPGHFLYADEGAPDLPGSSRYILVPEGTVIEMHVLRSRVDTYYGIDLMPAPKIPLDIEDKPLEYRKDSLIYGRDAMFPENPVWIETGLKMRGMQVVLLTIVPFQYNPVTRELMVYRDLRVRIDFKGGSGEFGIEKYRSRWWDPILRNQVLNFSSLPPTDYSHLRGGGSRTLTGCEYLIICPDGADFQQWADSIKAFRTEQGILTEVMTITETGGNTSSALESFINNAFNNWDIPPSAVLLLADHGTDPQNSITSVILNNHPSGYNPFVSDNIYADVDGDDLPDIAFARITARNATELELMVHKFMNYERNPPVSADFYDHPITALGWQTERWFQICSETVGGFFKNELGKNPVRINAIYQGNPDIDPWSTASNTTTVLDYFGPSGQGYIPSSPTTLGNWTGGNATMINNAINDGSFLLQHRDHGAYWGWGEPYYTTSNISGLTNTDLTFVMSVNCQTGKFEYSTETFTERFHRYSYGGQASGALGLIAATEVSYSFVNDVYIWGLYDYMWPEFMPTFGSSLPSAGLMPCFGNVAGKYHLVSSTWVSGYSSLYEITCNLFHHHGDAYLNLYSEVPQSLTVTHDPFILASQSSFTVTADSGALIALTCNGEILGTAVATGNPLPIPITGTLVSGEEMIVTATLTNYYRYRDVVDINMPAGPYVIFANAQVNDATGNNNSQLDCGETFYLTIGLQNLGATQAVNISAVLHCSDSLVTQLDSLAFYGNIPSGDTLQVPDGFQASISPNLPDGHALLFEIESTDGTTTWTDTFIMDGHAPVLECLSHTIDDSDGDNDGIFDAGETIGLNLPVLNSGSTMADDCVVSLSTSDPYVQIITTNLAYGDIVPGDTVTQSFVLNADPLTPSAHQLTLYILLSTDNSLPDQDSISLIIGKIPALVLDLDPNVSSGPSMVTAMQASGIDPDYSTTFPVDLSVYQSVFCCLGIYSTNHVLTTSEGQVLADYLDDGGCLYMEGGDTWAYDPQTSVHAMFNITGTADGSSDMGTVSGMTGTFTEGMSFTYSGANNYMDRLSPVSPAYTVLQNNSPVYGTCIAYDHGDYQTLGASHEFGGLTDGTSIKAQLMARYLLFFGVTVTSTWEGTTSQWNTPGNWSNGIVPGTGVNAFIPYNPGMPYPVQFSGGAASCRSLDVEPGATFSVPPGVIFTIGE